LFSVGWAPEDLDAWIEVPPGPFLYGDDKSTREIEQRYWISKYPVTNRQFARFVEAGGYREPDVWSEEGWAWREQQGIFGPRFWRDSERANPLCPVVGVSWYEADAYCRWLTRSGLMPADPSSQTECTGGLKVRLPSELEWERAARGTDARVYPWGDTEPTEELANFDE
jgi:formylglycine-generating enzyme required for sulfatase activity